MKLLMCFLWGICLSHLSLLSSFPAHAGEEGLIALDVQVDLQIPEKRDMKVLKKLSAKTDKKNSEERDIFDGVWTVTQISKSCPGIIGDFKVQIAGEAIDAVSEAAPTGFISPKGEFELDMASPDGAIKFAGHLQQKTGQGDWIQTRDGKEICQGVVTFHREGNEAHQ